MNVRKFISDNSNRYYQCGNCGTIYTNASDAENCCNSLVLETDCRKYPNIHIFKVNRRGVHKEHIYELEKRFVSFYYDMSDYDNYNYASIDESLDELLDAKVIQYEIVNRYLSIK